MAARNPDGERAPRPQDLARPFFSRGFPLRHARRTNQLSVTLEQPINCCLTFWLFFIYNSTCPCTVRDLVTCQQSLKSWLVYRI